MSEEILVPEFREPKYIIDDLTDLDDYEYQQSLAEDVDGTEDGAFVGDIFHGALSSAPRVNMYRSWVFPDLYPNERPCQLGNWSDEDLWDYCGIRKDMND